MRPVSFPVFHSIAVAAALLCMAVATRPAFAGDSAQPAIGIIIDDMGYQQQNGIKAIALPGPVAYSFLPGTPFMQSLTALARDKRKDIMLHLPLESGDKAHMESNSITLNMDRNQTLTALNNYIKHMPGIIGINNHMGSTYTQQRQNMAWLMEGIKSHGGLFFVDSYTTHTSIALNVAQLFHIPALRRDVFLDNEKTTEQIAFQFRRLLRKARNNGSALAIAHPHPVTLAYLHEVLPQLHQQGVRLAPITELINMNRQRSKSWQASLYRSHKAARNLKPSP